MRRKSFGKETSRHDVFNQLFNDPNDLRPLDYSVVLNVVTKPTRAMEMLKMRKLRCKTCLILMMFFVSNISFALTVTRAIDGDTIELSDGQKVRLLGVDTPESHKNSKLKKDLKRTGQSETETLALGKKSWKFTQAMTEGKEVRLEKEQSHKKDYFNRTLAYVYVNGKSLNEALISSGYACAYTKYQFNKKAKFVSLQKQAQKNKVGLWENQKMKCE